MTESVFFTEDISPPRVCIAGGREFGDYAVLCRAVGEVLAPLAKPVTIISGWVLDSILIDF